MQEEYYQVDIIEAELGWGSKIEDTFYFKDKNEVTKFIADYNKDLPRDHTPTYYVMARSGGTETRFSIVNKLNELFAKDPQAIKFHAKTLELK